MASWSDVLDRDSLRAWLDERPRSWEAALVAREAMRALPDIYSSGKHSAADDAYLLAAFRACLNLVIFARDNRSLFGFRDLPTTPSISSNPRIANRLSDLLDASMLDDRSRIAELLWSGDKTHVEQLLSDVRVLTFFEPAGLIRERLVRSISEASQYGDFLSRLARSPEKWRYWSNWYGAYVDGNAPFGLRRSVAEAVERSMLGPSIDWLASPEAINRAWQSSVESFVQSRPAGARVPATEFIIQMLEREHRPIRNSELASALEQARISMGRSSLDWSLTNLVTDRRITRLSRGYYGSNAYARETSAPDTDEDIESFSEPEAQTSSALQFTTDQAGRITLDPKAGSSQLLHDEEAIDRHAEARRIAGAMVSTFDPTAPGANTAVELIAIVQLYFDAAGNSVSECRPGLIVSRGDAIRRYAELQERHDLTDIAPLSDRHLFAVQQLVAAHNLFVAFDPELARRDEALLGPDALHHIVSPIDGETLIMNALASGATTLETQQALGLEASIAPPTPDPNSRISRRYSEGIKNFARAVLAAVNSARRFVWRHRKAVVGVLAATSAGAVLVAKWALANEIWFQTAFAKNPAMLSTIEQIMQFLKSLPLT